MATDPSFSPPGVPPPVYPASARGAPPAPSGPVQTNPMAIASLVASLLPALALVSPRIGVFIAGVGAILGIVFGFIALGQIRAEPHRYAGRGLAIAGIVIGIVVISLAVVAIVLAFLFVARLAALCGGTWTSSKFVPAFLITVGWRDASPQERHEMLRRLTAHHPACSHFDADVVHMGAVKLCRGCLAAGVAMLAAWALVTVLPWQAPWYLLVGGGFAIGLVQFVSVFGRARSTRAKLFVKTCLGLGIALGATGVLASPFPRTLQAGLIVAGWGAGVLLLLPRRARLQAHVCPGAD